jgi:CBS domain-containing protein
MKLREIMTREVETITPDASLPDAAQKMKTLDIGALPVCDDNRMIGMITDRDITVRAVAEGQDPAAMCVGDVMSPDLVFCYDDQDVQEAAKLMEEKQIRRLPVMDRSKRLVGIVSLGDIAVRHYDEKLIHEVLQQKLSRSAGRHFAVV